MNLYHQRLMQWHQHVGHVTSFAQVVPLVGNTSMGREEYPPC